MLLAHTAMLGRCEECFFPTRQDLQELQESRQFWAWQTHASLMWLAGLQAATVAVGGGCTSLKWFGGIHTVGVHHAASMYSACRLCRLISKACRLC